MARWLLLGSALALAACAATPAPPDPDWPLSAGQVPGIASDRASDAPPATPLLRGWRWPSPRRGWSPDEERPSWLPTLPQQLERYPVPQHWRRDSLAALHPPLPR